MKTKNGTKRIFAARKVTRAGASNDVYAPVDQFGEESGDMPSNDAVAVATRCIDLNKCAECTSPVACTTHRHCILSEGIRRAPEEHGRPQDWRDEPSKTFKWGAIQINPAFGNLSHTFGKQRWFRTQKGAREYGRVNYGSHYAVADYWEFP